MMVRYSILRIHVQHPYHYNQCHSRIVHEPVVIIMTYRKNVRCVDLIPFNTYFTSPQYLDSFKINQGFICNNPNGYCSHPVGDRSPPLLQKEVTGIGSEPQHQ
jgi:hypothetical protein